MSRRLTSSLVLLAVAMATTGLPRALHAAVNQGQFRKDLEALAAGPNRLAGLENGSLAAGKYVFGRLKEIGFGEGELFRQDFPVVQPITTECELVVDGKAYPILPARPNIVQASVTPAEGLTGQTVYVGKGEVPEYGSNFPADKIVLMDLDCELNWLDAFAFGARAVIFVGPAAGQTVEGLPYLHVNTPANLPRFYMPRELADRLGLTKPAGTRPVTIRAACRWREFRATNVIAVVRGTRPVMGEDTRRQALLLAAPLDSYGEVPELSPGARDAANCAALLQLAEYLRANPPRRDVILCFFDAQALNHMGARAFYGALYRKTKDTKLAEVTLEERFEQLDEERKFFEQLTDILSQEDMMASATVDMKYYDHALRMLRDEARSMGDQIDELLRPKRVIEDELSHKLAGLEKKADKAEDPQVKARLTAEADALRPQLEAKRAEIDAMNTESLRWNGVQRDLRYKKLSEENVDHFKRLQVITKDLCQRRLAELVQSRLEAEMAKRIYDALGPEKTWIVMHMGMNLGDAGSRWTFIHGDNSAPLEDDKEGIYGAQFKTMTAVWKELGDAVADFEPRAVSQIYENRLFAPAVFVDSTAIARLFAIWNLSVMTVADRLPRQGMPTDTLQALDSGTMYKQITEVAPFLKRLADQEGMGVRPTKRAEVKFADATWSGLQSKGATVRFGGMAGALRTRPARGAIVAFMHRDGWKGIAVDKSPPGFVDPILCKSNVHGIIEIGPYSTTQYKPPWYIAVLFDHAAVGDIQTESRGLIAAITSTSTLDSGGNNVLTAAPMIFECKSKTLVYYGAERGATPTTTMRALSTAQFPASRSLLCEWQNVTTVFAPADAKGIKLFSKTSLVALNNQETKERYQGVGLSLDDPFDHPPSQPMTAHDLRALNSWRLQLLREVRIHQESLEALNGKAHDLEVDAEASKDKSTVSGYFGTMEAAAAFSRLVYIPLIGVMNDLVAAVVLLLLLAMPFAYALERLLIGTPHIYRQIAWFALFFLLTFALLFTVNPAFKIASTPIIIFLAFAIILLSTLVIFIMVRKLQTEVRKMQGLASTVHSADVSRLSTMMAAVNMGISTMRRRPLRTLLTAATVVLLTFTILTFASFGSKWGIWRSYQGAMTGSLPHAFVRHPLWSPIGKNVYETLRGHLAGEAEVVPRVWVSATATQAQDAHKDGTSLEKLLSDTSINRIVPMAAAIGLDPADLKDPRGNVRQEELLDLFAPNAKVDLLAGDGIFLTQAIADELALTDADIGKTKLLFGGKTFTYGGVIEDRLATATSLDGSDVLPVDYEASAGESDENLKEQAEATVSLIESPDVQSAQFVTFNVDRVVVISPEAAHVLGGTIRAMTIYPAPGKLDALKDVAETATRVTQLPTYVGREGGVYRLIFTSLAKASGWKDLLVPVVLGGLIIFATMLGSVSDREREIYTFSSLGLAPPHVASLFFAEAAMYAVIGGMGGYLLGQIIARLLAWLSATFGWTVPTMNYSSTNAIVTILIVMGTVLISTLYPAMKASRSANPGIQRTWQIPKPKGNVYDLVFPFTVSAYDITGVVSFLTEHFQNFTDTSLGVFATTSCHVFRQKDTDMLGFQATVALAPFDLGVNQRFALLSQPSDIEGIDEVHILIYRLSGSPGDWQRGNRVFINDLRKQLLIWRSLPHEIMDEYRRKTLDAWDELPVEQINQDTIGADAQETIGVTA